MQTYALIFNSKVVNLVLVEDGADPSFLLNDAVDTTVLLPDRPEVGWSYDGANFAPPDPDAPQPVTTTLDPDDVTAILASLAKSNLDPKQLAEIQAKLTSPSADVVAVAVADEP